MADSGQGDNTAKSVGEADDYQALAGQEDSGELWLKAVQGKHLTSGKKFNALICMYLDNKKKDAVKTKVIKETESPMWNDEFIFQLPSMPATLNLKCQDWSPLGRNTTLGKASFRLSDVIQPRQLWEGWVELESEKGSVVADDVATVQLKLQWTPKRIPKPTPPIHLHSFRVTLERLSYYPGETIRGFLTFNVGAPKKVKSIKISFRGKSHVRWEESSGDSTTVYSAIVRYFQTEAVVLGPKPNEKKGEPQKLDSNCYVWPFEFVLPKELPPSFVGNHGKTVYSVLCSADIGTLKSKASEQNVRVVHRYPDPPKTVTGVQNTTSGVVTGGQAVRVKVTVPDVVHLKTTFSITVEIDNKSDKTVKSAVIELEELAKFFGKRSANGRFYLNVSRATIFKQQVTGIAFPLAPGQSGVATISVVFPGQLSVSSTEQATIILVTHFLKVRALTDGNIFNKTHTTAKVRITIGAMTANKQEEPSIPDPRKIAKISIVQKPVASRYSVPVSQTSGTGAATAINPFDDDDFSEIELSGQSEEIIKGAMDPAEVRKFELEKLIPLKPEEDD